MNQLIAWGLVLGSIMILGAIGLTMSVQIARFFNFAHGDLMTLGAYIAFLVSGLLAGAEFLQRGIGPFSFGWGLLLSFIPAILVTAAVAILFDRWVYRPLRERKALASYSDMASMGLAFLLRGLIYVVWGADYHFYFKGIRATVNLPLGIRLRTDELFIMAVAWALVAVFYLFLTRTKTGKALRDQRGAVCHRWHPLRHRDAAPPGDGLALPAPPLRHHPFGRHRKHHRRPGGGPSSGCGPAGFHPVVAAHL